MYRVDVYRSVKTEGNNGTVTFKKKKLSSHWYPTEQEAAKASKALYNMPYGTYVFVPREGKNPIAVTLGGYSTSKPIKDDTFK